MHKQEEIQLVISRLITRMRALEDLHAQVAADFRELLSDRATLLATIVLLQGKSSTSQPDQKLSQNKLVSVREARSILGNIGPTTIYKFIATGELEKIKFGSRTFISVASIDKFIQRQKESVKRS